MCLYLNMKKINRNIFIRNMWGKKRNVIPFTPKFRDVNRCSQKWMKDHSY